MYVTGPANPLLESGPSTQISVEGKGGLSIALNRAQNNHTISASDRFLIDVFRRFNDICERASIPRKVRERCNEIFKQYYDTLTLKDDGTRSRSLREDETAQIIAGVLFLSCRIEGITRSFKEISRLTNIVKRDIGRAVKAIEDKIQGVKVERLQEPNTDFIARFCNQLDLPRDVTIAATELAERARNIKGVYGRADVSVATACIFIICQLGKPENKRTAKQISDVAHVAEVTIRASYKKIYPYLKEILPESYKNLDSFSNLPSS